MTRQATFVGLMIDRAVLAFGDFTLKSGRKSPYFFNLGAIDDGPGLAALGRAYATEMVETGMVPDVIFGPAYKGIPLAVAAALALYRDHGVEVGVTFNRKEAKHHGEGGVLVGAPLAGDVLIVDDVMTAGTAVSAAAALVRGTGARLSGVLIALDRQERMQDGTSAVHKVSEVLAAPVHSIVTLQDVISYLDLIPAYADALVEIRSYQQQHCVVS